MKRWIVCVGFLALVVGGGLTIGAVTAPGQWYAQLSKPSFSPPGYVFGPVWTVLYVLIAIAGWRTWERQAATPMKVWWAQLALKFTWSPAFFAAHRIGIALFIVLLLLGNIGAFIALSWRQDRLTAWLFVPYAAWVAFASVLNASIYWLSQV